MNRRQTTMKRACLVGLLALAAVGWGDDAAAQQAQLYCRQADNGAFVPVQPGQPCPVAVTPSGAAAAAIVPDASVAAANSLVIKAGAGNLFWVYATNTTATNGFLMVFNATSAPADGAVVPLDCVALAGNSTASIAGDPPARYGTGIVAVLSSGANCFTKTTGVITGFISGGAI